MYMVDGCWCLGFFRAGEIFILRLSSDKVLSEHFKSKGTSILGSPLTYRKGTWFRNLTPVTGAVNVLNFGLREYAQTVRCVHGHTTWEDGGVRRQLVRWNGQLYGASTAVALPKNPGFSGIKYSFPWVSRGIRFETKEEALATGRKVHYFPPWCVSWTGKRRKLFNTLEEAVKYRNRSIPPLPTGIPVESG